MEALDYYTNRGWTVHVSTWVVGIQGLIDPPHIHALLDFLDIPCKLRKLAVEQTVLARPASVKVLYSLAPSALWEPVWPSESRKRPQKQCL